MAGPPMMPAEAAAFGSGLVGAYSYACPFAYTTTLLPLLGLEEEEDGAEDKVWSRGEPLML